MGSSSKTPRSHQVHYQETRSHHHSRRHRHHHHNYHHHHLLYKIFHNSYTACLFSHRNSSGSFTSSRWTRILILALCQMASVLSQALTQNPKFGEPIPNVTVAVGRDASLPCVVENLGNHKVAWVHIDRRMVLTIHKHIVTRIPRFQVSFDNQKSWLLHINGVQESDRGYYMCQVNTEPMISQVGYLQVVVPPNILDNESSESHVAVREHQNITLSCKANGFPEPRITWQREDGQAITVDRRKKVNVSEGERLHLYKISRLDMGAYLCIASNGVPPSVSKRIIVDVEFTPMIWVPSQLVGSPSNTNVTIECHTEAFPRAISYWVHDNMMILTSGKYETDTEEHGYRTHMRLTIKNLQEKDFGKYKCLSKNSLGETEGSIQIYPIPMPSMAPKPTGTRKTKDGVGVVTLQKPPGMTDVKSGKGGKGIFGSGRSIGKSNSSYAPFGNGIGVGSPSRGNSYVPVNAVESSASSLQCTSKLSGFLQQRLKSTVLGFHVQLQIIFHLTVVLLVNNQIVCKDFTHLAYAL